MITTNVVRASGGQGKAAKRKKATKQKGNKHNKKKAKWVSRGNRTGDRRYGSEMLCWLNRRADRQQSWFESGTDIDVGAGPCKNEGNAPQPKEAPLQFEYAMDHNCSPRATMAPYHTGSPMICVHSQRRLATIACERQTQTQPPQFSVSDPSVVCCNAHRAKTVPLSFVASKNPRFSARLTAISALIRALESFELAL